jgi:hypothetical protein
MSSSQLKNQLREDEIEAVDGQVSELAALQFGRNTEIVQAAIRKDNIKIHLQALRDLLERLEQADAAAWTKVIWGEVKADHKLIKQQDVFLSGLNAANDLLQAQRNTALYERARIDKAIAEGKSDDPELRAMLRSLESDAYYIVWNSIDDTVCKLFPTLPMSAIHAFMNALSGSEPLSAYQYELLAALLATFEEQAAIK